MSAWRGLRNPTRHRDDSGIGAWSSCIYAWGGCGEGCFPEKPCRCCLVASLQAVRDLCDERERDGGQYLGPDTLTVAEVRAAMGGAG